MALPKGVDLDARYKILAVIFESFHVYKQGIHTRLPELVILNEWILVGRSESGGGHKEHVVPLAFLIAESYRMFDDGKTTDDVAAFLKANLKIVDITKDEAKRLDHGPSTLRTRMPDGWKRGDDPFARLTWGNIKWTPVDEFPSPDSGEKKTA